MKNRFGIIFTDVSGSRYYSFHQVMKKIVVYALITVALVIVVGAMSINFLLKQVETIEEKRDMVQRDYEDMLSKNDKLQEEIATKTDELVTIADKIEDLEGIVGLTKPEDANLTLIERIDMAKVTGAHKKVMHQLIPSGSPLDVTVVTSPFGTRNHPILNRNEFHSGIDLRASMGTPIYAPADGVVDYVRSGYNSGYGNILKITHAFGFKTIYGHLKGSPVKPGDFVKKGDVVAYSGDSGLSNGPHLHYEVRYIGQALNPYNFIYWDMKNFGNIFEKENKVQWDSLLAAVNRIMEVQAPLLSQPGPKLTAR